MLDIKTLEGYTALIICCMYNGYKCMDVLLEKNKESAFSNKDNENNSVEDLVYKHGHKECSECYRKHFPIMVS